MAEFYADNLQDEKIVEKYFQNEGNLFAVSRIFR